MDDRSPEEAKMAAKYETSIAMGCQHNLNPIPATSISAASISIQVDLIATTTSTLPPLNPTATFVVFDRLPNEIQKQSWMFAAKNEVSSSRFAKSMRMIQALSCL